jgi:hypothetical protein
MSSDGNAMEKKYEKTNFKLGKNLTIVILIVIASLAALCFVYADAERHARAGAAAESNSDWDGAKREYMRALRRFPFKGEYYHSLERVYMQLGDAAKAESFGRKSRLLGAS